MNDIVKRINELKKEKNAVILAHYYVEDEIQEIADYVGDSFYLAKIATTVKEDTIVFCGVSFMGESAKILNPKKKVLMPDASADCPMAHMASIEKIQEIKKLYEDVSVVCYVNSSAKLKSYSDVCVTSSNALKIVKNISSKNIFFIPDENLGRYVAGKLPEKNFIFNDGYCPIHKDMTKKNLLRVKEKYPNAKVMVHPECTDDVLKLADYIGSTSGIIDYATESDEKEFIVVTELGVLYELRCKNPNKKFYDLGIGQCCPDMKKITLEKVLNSLVNNESEVILDKELMKKAYIPLKRMLEMGK
ncbi:quinolinate synthase NadA [Anaerofustis sp.]|uniref:quinolinate synthase NadA n=1 Tax=Anaerofustis sp. TaxID=1872517 RepID=UPI0025B85ABF|nr:quinolinate synthase NadA [Anaerofustis sp.]